MTNPINSKNVTKIIRKYYPAMDTIEEKVEEKIEKLLTPEEVETLFKKKEAEVTKAAKDEMKKEIDFLRERCDFILQNEQVRASYMLREAHRERQEKIQALQTQLECKNLAGLMYVMCTERKKSKMEKRRLTEEYTTYIQTLQDILSDAQKLILDLSRGYKTAARVDHEWREKMKKVIFEFQSFVNDFTGGTSEANQYFFDVPKLLKTETPTTDNPLEDPCEDEVVAEEIEPEKQWWERMGDDCRPFLVCGDMAEFSVPQRREVLTNVKAQKTAPKKWKEYVFRDMFVSSDCNNADEIKDEYPLRFQDDCWECPGPTARVDLTSRVSIATFSRRTTRASEDIKGGSILKIISAGTSTSYRTEKTAILGARDSMEIASTTKLRTTDRTKTTSDHGSVVIRIGGRRQSSFNEVLEDVRDDMKKAYEILKEKQADYDEKDEVSVTKFKLNKTDSKEVMAHHKPDMDHTINYEKVCPVEKCQRLKTDSFIRSLPPYMRANPFTHFEQHFDQYETCTQEQLAILSQRIADRKDRLEIDEDTLKEWTPSVDGVAVQTSDLSVNLPPCTCRDPFNSPASSRGMVYDLINLMPVKHNLDTVNKECLYDDDIEFNRFNVVGQTDSTGTIKKTAANHDQSRVQEITQILKQHPSLLDIFQSNAHCS